MTQTQPPPDPLEEEVRGLLERMEAAPVPAHLQDLARRLEAALAAGRARRDD
ncbi:hypothetical protein [Paracoccus aestuarii]|uniref:hypothetical protein n=1 Tax=Paracoccus aestuarii TaxID=453842 RepID=UPI002350F2AE|nr:hypothetical protein [Paracoccus aestuarii]WCR00920.1 hypothetical protein JHW48_16715 [Paracoccus aestuarii]